MTEAELRSKRCALLGGEPCMGIACAQWRWSFPDALQSTTTINDPARPEGYPEQVPFSLDLGAGSVTLLHRSWRRPYAEGERPAYCGAGGRPFAGLHR